MMARGSLGSLPLVAAIVMIVGCADRQTILLNCRQASRSADPSVTWILRLDPSAKTAEMVMSAPADSGAVGVPSGNRQGKLRVTDRAYEIQIPFDEGGTGKDKWYRLAFTFEVDRYTGGGTAYVGGKTAEVTPSVIQCDTVTNRPAR